METTEQAITTTESALSNAEQVVTTTETALSNAEQLDTIIQGIDQLNTYLGSAIVIAGIVISFVLVRFLWRYIFKPILRDYIKLPL